jgi:hypothetical protein
MIQRQKEKLTLLPLFAISAMPMTRLSREFSGNLTACVIVAEGPQAAAHLRFENVDLHDLASLRAPCVVPFRRVLSDRVPLRLQGDLWARW